MVLAILPLTIDGIIEYNLARNSLRAATVDALVATSELKTELIGNWFSYRILDLQSQALHKENEIFLTKLIAAYHNSGRSLDEFVKSRRWGEIAKAHESDLIAFRETYGYYDVILIDTEGNILFTVKAEPDLGSNLFFGEYSHTLFSKACRKALNTGDVTFSDYGLYAPSQYAPSGFLVTPITSDSVGQIGLLAFQLPIDHIDEIMQNRSGLGRTGETYLVGADFKMRSNSVFTDEATVLVKEVNTEITRLWYAEHLSHTMVEPAKSDTTLIYTGPHGKKVIGIHDEIFIAGVPWSVVSEIEEDEAFAAMKTQGYISVTLLVITILLVAFTGITIGRNIVRPIEKLSSIAKEATSGDYRQDIKIDSDDEIGELAASLDIMLKRRHEAEHDLRAYAHDLQTAKEALEENASHLAQAIDDLKTSNDELDDFAYIASHDLKEPLRGIHNYSQFLLEDYEDKLDEEGVNKLSTLVTLTQRMETLINSLLEFSRLGRSKMAIVETDLNEIVADVIESLKIRLAEEMIEVRVPKLLPTVKCDRVRIAEIFRNLISNAIKYGDKQDRWIEIGCNETPADSDVTTLYVADNGLGITEKQTTNIFRIFKRLHGRDKYGGGTGMGLTIAKKIAERHGGAIWVESEIGVGSKFFFTITGGESHDDHDRDQAPDADHHDGGGQSTGSSGGPQVLREVGHEKSDCAV